MDTRRIPRWLRRRHPFILRVVATIAIVVLFVLVLWVVPAALTSGDYSQHADRMKAQSDARGNLVTLLGTLGLLGGLAYTARTFRLSREGQITDRFSRAVEQLGSEKIEVRLGGIYALERLMRDSPLDQPGIMETLAAFVRHQNAADHVPIDVQAILTVLGRRHPVDNERPIDLEGTHLRFAQLYRANLRGVDLDGADLTGANLGRANLTSARLIRANLSNAWLISADLADARLCHADLTDAILTDAHLTRAGFSRGALSESQLARTRHTEEIDWDCRRPEPGTTYFTFPD